MTQSTAMNRIEYNVKQILSERGCTQSDLASDLGMDKSNLSRLLKGKHSPSVNAIEDIAGVLEVDVSALLRPIPEPAAV